MNDGFKPGSNRPLLGYIEANIGEIIPGIEITDPNYVLCDGTSLSTTANPELAKRYPKLTAIERSGVPTVQESWSPLASNADLFVALATGSSAFNGVSTDGITWSPGVWPSASIANPSCIAWNGSIFCAGGSSTANVATSTNGLTWTVRTAVLPASQNWQVMAASDTAFCMIGGSTTLGARSTDGITWAEITLPSATGWRGITWNGSIFCAVGSDSATSTDGITWVTSLTATDSVNGVAWSPTLGIFATAGSNNIRTSTDGRTWTLRTTQAGGWFSIAWNGTVFCASASTTTSNVVTSTDGITWSLRTLPITLAVNSLRAKNGIFCAVGLARILLSNDNGQTWTAHRSYLGATISIVSAFRTEGMIYAAAANTTQLLFSTNGISWDHTPIGFGSITANSLASINSVLIISSLQTNPVVPRYSMSTKSALLSGSIGHLGGQVVTTNTGASTHSVVATSEKLICTLSSSTRTIISSTDGISWDTHVNALPVNGYWRLYWFNSIFFAHISSSTNLATSTDGITWTTRTAPQAVTTVTTNGAAWNSAAGLYIVSCTSSTQYLTSPDTITWTARALPVTGSGASFAASGTLFVMVSNIATSTCYSSTDGITWDPRTLPSSQTWTKVAYTNNLFIASASNGTALAVSTDGITWTARTCSSSNPTEMLWTGSVYISSLATGNISGWAYTARTFTISTDAVTWTTWFLDPTVSIGSTPQVAVKNGNVFVPGDLNLSILVPASELTKARVSYNWRKVLAEKNDVYMLGYDGAVGKSTDTGLTWALSTIPTPPGLTQWASMAKSPSTFCAINGPALGTTAATSTDGVTWVLRSLPVASTWTDIAYGNGVFVASGASPAVWAYSTDGISWLQGTMLPTYITAGARVFFTNGMFIITFNATVVFAIATSRDGRSWDFRHINTPKSYPVVIESDDNVTGLLGQNTTYLAINFDPTTLQAPTSTSAYPSIQHYLRVK